jgi:hypothetical protein
VSCAGITMQVKENSPTNLFLYDKDILVKAILRNGKVLITAHIFAGPRGQPAEIEENTFKLVDPSWDRNYDETAFEIVNENNNPVLQVIYKTQHDVAVYGIFKGSARDVFYVTPNGMFINSLSPIQLKRLFKYPSRKYLGQEETN